MILDPLCPPRLTEAEKVDETHEALRHQFDALVEDKLGDSFDEDELDDYEAHTPSFDLYEDDLESHRHAHEQDPTPESGDQYLGAEVLLPKEGQYVSATIKKRVRTVDGNIKGTAHANPILDTREYQVEFPDGDVASYTANQIAENMWEQCDEAGNQFMLMKEICDYKKD